MLSIFLLFFIFYSKSSLDVKIREIKAGNFIPVENYGFAVFVASKC